MVLVLQYSIEIYSFAKNNSMLYPKVGVDFVNRYLRELMRAVSSYLPNLIFFLCVCVGEEEKGQLRTALIYG